MTVPQEKCDKVCAIVADTLVADNARTLRANELATTAGLCSHLGEIYPQARRRLHPVWADMNAAGVYSLWSRTPQANPSVQLSELSRKNLAWALKSLATPPRRTLHCHAGTLLQLGPQISRVCPMAGVGQRRCRPRHRDRCVLRTWLVLPFVPLRKSRVGSLASRFWVQTGLQNCLVV